MMMMFFKTKKVSECVCVKTACVYVCTLCLKSHLDCHRFQYFYNRMYPRRTSSLSLSLYATPVNMLTIIPGCVCKYRLERHKSKEVNKITSHPESLSSLLISIDLVQKYSTIKTEVESTSPPKPYAEPIVWQQVRQCTSYLGELSTPVCLF